jgi:hypothetical protein
MKVAVIFLSIFLLAGCFFVFKDGDKIKIYGSPKESVSDVLNKLEEIKPEEKKEIITINAETKRIK